MNVKSLFVVSLPRSLSTTLYHAARRSLCLAEPTWTTGGEILNRERIGFRNRKARPENVRFTLREEEPETFDRVTSFLSGMVQQHGFAYKDVLQPFVLAEWHGLADFCVLKVKRDVAEIAYSMLKRKWSYPGHAASLHSDHPWAVIEGLLRAESAIESLPGETVDYAEAIAGHDALSRALVALYPNSPLQPIEYIDHKFVRTRNRLETERFDSTLFREVQHAVEVVRSRIGVVIPPPPAPGPSPIALPGLLTAAAPATST